MFKGYVSYGDTELVNVARLAKYAVEGGVPSGTAVTPKVGDYSALADALGDEPYRNPLLDSPPWYDSTNPDSAFFAGLMPLEITGLDGSTRGRQVTEGLTDGGAPGPVRAASRSIGVTVLALGASQAALDAGLSWLSGTLHPPCAGAPEACSGAPLALFSAPPVFCDNLPDLDAEEVTSFLIGEETEVPGPSLAFYDLAGGYLDPVCGEVTVSATVRMADDEEDATTAGRTVVLDLVDSAGHIYATSGPVTLPDTMTGDEFDSVTLTVTTDPSPGFPADWQPVLSWYGPSILDGGDSSEDTDEIYDGGDSEGGDDLVDGGDSDGPWSVGPAYGGVLIIEEWSLTRLPFLTAAECLDELRRSFRNVVTIEGPTVIEELTLDDGETFAARVEWTWVATDPVAYGSTSDLMRGLLVGRGGGGNPSVVVASTENMPLFVPLFGIYDMDGWTSDTSNPAFATNRIYPGDRLLLKDQTNEAENGIYTYIGGGSLLVRVDDLNTWAEAETAGVYVQSGTTQAGTYWVTDVAGGGTINVTDMPWEAGTPPDGSYDNGFIYKAPGIQLADNEEVEGVDTACPLPEATLLLCGDDPDLPGLLVPPTPPSLPDPGMPEVETYVRREFQIPPEQSPQPGGVVTMNFHNLGGAAYRGIRVRLWADDDPDFGVTEECEFEQEFYLTYLADGQTVTVNGLDHRVTTTCIEGIDADHGRSMRGAYGGPFAFPVLRCGSRYHVTIDVPVTEDAAGLSVDMSVTRGA